MQPKKSKKRKIVVISSVAAVALIAAGAGVFVFQSQGVKGMAAKASAMGEAMSTTAEIDDISTTVVGTGTLAADTANDVKVPAGITVKDVLVESGDKVTEGDILATLDEASVATALADTQEQITSIDEEINEVKDDTQSSYITTYVSGRVKKIYAESDTAVNTTMSENGALVLLSIGGKMAVKLEDVSTLAADDTVTVTLSDGDTVEGTVASINGTTAIVTMSDNGPEYEEAVVVTDSDGTVVGDGKLYIYQQLEITGSGGTVYSIYVSENDNVSAETALMKLTDVPETAEYKKLLAQRSQLAEELQVLMQLAETNAITATYSGTIQSVNVSEDTTIEKNSASSSTSNTSTTTGGFTASVSGELIDQSIFTMTSAALETSDTAEDSDKSAKTETLTAIVGTIVLEIAAPVEGAVPQDSIEVVAGDIGKYTARITWNQSVNTFAAGTSYIAIVHLTAAEGYEFGAANQLDVSVPGFESWNFEVLDLDDTRAGNETMRIMITYPATVAETETATEKEPATDTEKGSETETQGTTGNTPDTTNTEANSNKNSAGAESESGNTNLTESTGNASGSGAVSASNSAASSGTATTASGSDSTTSSSVSSEIEANYVTAFTISTDETMVISVSIDELDILTIAQGQKATVTLDALEGEAFEGEITYISDSASASGGVTKYTAEVTIEKSDSMLAGMNASVMIVTKSSEGVIVLPADAVCESGNRQFVYTEKDEESGELSGEVGVETGLSDGTNVEITSGLEEGQTVYYQRVISTESTDEESGFMMKGGMMNGGEMPPMDNMPSGGGNRSGSGMPGGQ